MKFARGETKTFDFDVNTPTTVPGPGRENNIYTLRNNHGNIISAVAEFSLNESTGAVARLERVKIGDMDFPVLYDLQRKPAEIIITLAKAPIYPTYNFDFVY